MLRIENLSFSFPQKDLYKDISFTLEKGQHCAFIGSSGSGKSTLVEMILDPEKLLYDGKIIFEDTIKLGYVSQFSKEEGLSDPSVFHYIAYDYHQAQEKITKICDAMATSEDMEPLLVAYQEALDALDAFGGGDFESDIHRKLHLAGLTKHTDQKISELSGGEFKLVQIIKEMMLSPELLIMDEPDAFLDFENLLALKSLINAHKGVLLVITHNRFLLNHCFNKILHLENQLLQEFDGNFVDYNFTLLQEKIERQELSIADDEEIARNEALIHKLRLIATSNSEASRGKALKARVKIQERLEARRIQAPFVDIKKPNIKLITEDALTDVCALSVKDYTVSYDDMLLENVTFEIGGTEKVAIIGRNGSGKTTLLREIFKRAQDSIQIHPQVKMTYLAQNQNEVFDASATVKEMFLEENFSGYDEIERYLTRFGFCESILDQKIERLSGGEKTILQLAKLSHQGSNFLLLDEPTSHLDTYSQIALDSALETYNGGLLMVSHDYYTIANCVDYVLFIENKTIRKMSARKFRKMVYEGHFDKDYLEFEQSKKALELEIEKALHQTDFEQAKLLSEKLELVLKAM